MTLEPIGVVRNSVVQATDEHWGAVASEIRVKPDLADGLRGLSGFSHVVVVFVMHAAQFEAKEHLVRRPRDRSDMPSLGIFAQRARHRPNAIGITTVPVERIEAGSLFVRGLDAMDGSPVLDLKPHFPVFDAPLDPRVPAWVERLMEGYF